MTTTTRPELRDERVPGPSDPSGGGPYPARPEPAPAARARGGQADRGSPDEPGVRGSLRRLLGELGGTFALTFVAAGAEVIAALSEGEVSAAAGRRRPD